ncbi:(2Fe-2S) ferredoxin domain-containing protein [Acidithiobacillus sp.]|jgi:(2Fe-2S) ferredoxin|uniref:(2Fe-2S) ferredoxin domain-containing protein n=1 Tax=Acidithiobacillus sp. TaxID=1872118 RepID=UPI0025BE8F45|nr:(2Fe-2S) ferredoxin domain-containing protein [Acidithiobacillus sp.]MCK9187900.1 (2Fe-2S) ferredoxin domain-containing protein [Acidithiobacillus sp.]MCK9359859.1 (2Fe-2S) ferredoxin domain-containing protein [Acidithiobacillus sp.]
MEGAFYQRHMFLCLNHRDNGEQACNNSGLAEEMFHVARKHAKTLGIHGEKRVRVNRCGCLGRCSDGPVAVVYPDAVWYTYVDADDVREIVDSHLRDGLPVERLRI